MQGVFHNLLGIYALATTMLGKNKIYKLIKKYLAYYSNVYIILPRGLVAQWLERSAHNALVVGSSPT